MKKSGGDKSGKQEGPQSPWNDALIEKCIQKMHSAIWCDKLHTILWYLTVHYDISSAFRQRTQKLRFKFPQFFIVLNGLLVLFLSATDPVVLKDKTFQWHENMTFELNNTSTLIFAVPGKTTCSALNNKHFTNEVSEHVITDTIEIYSKQFVLPSTRRKSKLSAFSSNYYDALNFDVCDLKLILYKFPSPTVSLQLVSFSHRYLTRTPLVIKWMAFVATYVTGHDLVNDWFV